jgi:CheY-like chemotaxis protein
MMTSAWRFLVTRGYFGNLAVAAHTDSLRAVLRCVWFMFDLRGEHFAPQIILMDVGMPRLNGYEATRRIRRQPWGTDIKIIAFLAVVKTRVHKNAQHLAPFFGQRAACARS